MDYFLVALISIAGFPKAFLSSLIYLFIIYSSQLFNVIEKQLPCVHCFADDAQLYVSLKPDGQVSQDAAIGTMERCVADIRRRMINYRLLLNGDKTEVLLIGSQYQLKKKLDCSSCLRVGNNDKWSVALEI